MNDAERTVDNTNQEIHLERRFCKYCREVLTENELEDYHLTCHFLIQNSELFTELWTLKNKMGEEIENYYSKQEEIDVNFKNLLNESNLSINEFEAIKKDIDIELSVQKDLDNLFKLDKIKEQAFNLFFNEIKFDNGYGYSVNYSDIFFQFHDLNNWKALPDDKRDKRVKNNPNVKYYCPLFLLTFYRVMGKLYFRNELFGYLLTDEEFNKIEFREYF